MTYNGLSPRLVRPKPRVQRVLDLFPKLAGYHWLVNPRPVLGDGGGDQDIIVGGCGLDPSGDKFAQPGANLPDDVRHVCEGQNSVCAVPVMRSVKRHSNTAHAMC